jgi:hypothetical protein
MQLLPTQDEKLNLVTRFNQAFFALVECLGLLIMVIDCLPI